MSASPRSTLVDGGYGEDGQPLTHASRGKLVVKHAKGEGNVVRLISGDPWMYATGAEEASACAKARIVFEVVPGISSVTAVPAYAGVPLTTRTSREVTVLNVAENKIDWSSYAGSQTLVLLHAVKRARRRRAGTDRRRTRPGDAGRGDLDRHDDRAADRGLDAGRHRGRRARRPAARAGRHRRR